MDLARSSAQSEPCPLLRCRNAFSHWSQPRSSHLSPRPLLLPTQGWFKFGGVEYFKINITKKIGDQSAWDNRQKIYLASSAMAEFIADIFLCPYEACRIRLVSNPAYASGMASCASKLMADYGFVGAFYSGFIPILFKQIPYTMVRVAPPWLTPDPRPITSDPTSPPFLLPAHKYRPVLL